MYLPLDGLSATLTSPVADSVSMALFPKGATVRTAPSRQGSVRAILLDGITQYGLVKGVFDWIYDLEKSPSGITILFYFQLPVTPAGPAYLLSVGDRIRDPSNAAGFDILVNSATSNVEIRFGEVFGSAASFGWLIHGILKFFHRIQDIQLEMYLW
jgi:hypothetical protein